MSAYCFQSKLTHCSFENAGDAVQIYNHIIHWFNPFEWAISGTTNVYFNEFLHFLLVFTLLNQSKISELPKALLMMNETEYNGILSP